MIWFKWYDLYGGGLYWEKFDEDDDMVWYDVIYDVLVIWLGFLEEDM